VAFGVALVGWLCLTAPEALPLLSPIWPTAIILEGSLALVSVAVAVHEAALEAILQCYCAEAAAAAQQQSANGAAGDAGASSQPPTDRRTPSAFGEQGSSHFSNARGAAFGRAGPVIMDTTSSHAAERAAEAGALFGCADDVSGVGGCGGGRYGATTYGTAGAAYGTPSAAAYSAAAYGTLTPTYGTLPPTLHSDWRASTGAVLTEAEGEGEGGREGEGDPEDEDEGELGGLDDRVPPSYDTLPLSASALAGA